MERLVHEHHFLPPRTPNAYADVESSHDRIETEFFDLEMFHSRRDFFEKITTYQNWWNFARKNYSKGNRTPAEILEEEGINPLFLLRNPDDLDALLRRGEKIRGWVRIYLLTPSVDESGADGDSQDLRIIVGRYWNRHRVRSYRR